MTEASASSSAAKAGPGAASFYIEGGAVHMEQSTSISDKSRAAERYFIAGIRKNAEIAADLRKNCRI